MTGGLPMKTRFSILLGCAFTLQFAQGVPALAGNACEDVKEKPCEQRVTQEIKRVFKQGSFNCPPKEVSKNLRSQDSKTYWDGIDALRAQESEISSKWRKKSTPAQNRSDYGSLPAPGPGYYRYQSDSRMKPINAQK